MKYMPKLILEVCTVMDKKVLRKALLADLYAKFWNPINYALVGGIGVLINFTVWLLLQNVFAWWITNILAILIAWSWNWLNSVGSLGWIWGFKERKGGD